MILYFSGEDFERSLPVPTSIDEMKIRLASFERRLRAVEQPSKSNDSRLTARNYTHVLVVWQISAREEDWEVCAEGPCKCVPEIKSVSCWRHGLLDLPAAQLVPADVLRL